LRVKEINITQGEIPWHRHATSVAKAPALVTMFRTQNDALVAAGIQTFNASAPSLVDTQSVKMFALHA